MVTLSACTETGTHPPPRPRHEETIHSPFDKYSLLPYEVPSTVPHTGDTAVTKPSPSAVELMFPGGSRSRPKKRKSRGRRQRGTWAAGPRAGGAEEASRRGSAETRPAEWRPHCAVSEGMPGSQLLRQEDVLLAGAQQQKLGESNGHQSLGRTQGLSVSPRNPAGRPRVPLAVPPAPAHSGRRALTGECDSKRPHCFSSVTEGPSAGSE